MSDSLSLPERIEIQLTNQEGIPLKMPGVIFGITLFARRKNNFHLGPFVTDENGRAKISKRELEAHVSAHYDSGLMDYGHLSDCAPVVEIQLWTQDQIQRALEARTRTWTELLSGERDVWPSIEHLLSLYRSATNRLIIPVQTPSIRDRWDKTSGGEYSYNFAVTTT